MALNDSDLEGFEMVSTRKPEKAGGVTVSSIPAGLVALLKEHAPKALEDKDYELILRVPVRPDYSAVPAVPTLTEKSNADAKEEAAKATEAAAKATAEADVAAQKKATDTVKQLALYSVAWGKGQEPKLYIHKVPNRKDMPDNHARLAVDKWDDVPAENRPGRR